MPTDIEVKPDVSKQLPAKVEKPLSAEPSPAFTAAYPPVSLIDLWQAWLGWMCNLLNNNRMPLSGDVTQWIKAWGEVVSQFGLFNVNIAGSSDFPLEKAIASRYSYGRELGRIVDVLAPMVAGQKEDSEAKRHFEEMVSDIKSLKEKRYRGAPIT